MQIFLTDEQIDQVAPLLEKAKRENEKGKPGMVVAQIFADTMTVGFVAHEQAKLLETKGTIK